jgi:hypothetical protein
MSIDTVGFRPIGVGRGEGRCNLYEEPGYSLPFKVVGYYSLIGCEPIDGFGETISTTPADNFAP